MSRWHAFRASALIAVLLGGAFGLLRAPEQYPLPRPRAVAAFLVVGDLMLSRGVATAMARARDPLVPFSRMRSTFRSVAFAFGNLESPFAVDPGAKPSANRMVFGAPSEALSGLMDAGFRVLNLANNHTLDQRAAGLLRTTRLLDENSVQHVGAGANLQDAWEPAIVAVNGIRIGFVGASYSSLNDLGAAKNVPYVARIEDRERLQSTLTRLRGRVDFIVVTMHAGIEYTHKPDEAQIGFAHAAIDDGADLVAGAHSHWVQSFETYRGKPVFYGLGNFVFDQTWSMETMRGLALRVVLSRPAEGGRAHLEQIELIPVIIEHASTPRPALPREAREILHAAGMDNVLSTGDGPAVILPPGLH